MSNNRKRYASASSMLRKILFTSVFVSSCAFVNLRSYQFPGVLVPPFRTSSIGYDISRGSKRTNGPPNKHCLSSSQTVSNNVTGRAGLPGNFTSAAKWHRDRRRAMLQKYSSKIKPLEQDAHGMFVGLPLLLFSNVAITFMALLSAKLNLSMILVTAWFGSIFSLWQLQILHDCLHGSLLPKHPITPPASSANSHFLQRSNQKVISSLNNLVNRMIKNRGAVHSFLLKYGSMPSAFGYNLYLSHGHLTHHKNLGNPSTITLEALFDSKEKDFEDGDVLFVAHRMRLLGNIGPKFRLFREIITVSISRMAFSQWRDGRAVLNACIFILSFIMERCLLVGNEFIVALAGKNFFFPNKPKDFHLSCASYSRLSVTVKSGICLLVKSWKPLLFLILVETLWSIPPHPACAMFVTNHGSSTSINTNGEKECIPSSSTYAGFLYSMITLGTNYHVEHHDFPTIPLHKLYLLKHIAPEFYRNDRDNLVEVMRNAFANPEYYACMNTGIKEFQRPSQ